jgi:hypothetical protein
MSKNALGTLDGVVPAEILICAAHAWLAPQAVATAMAAVTSMRWKKLTCFPEALCGIYWNMVYP